MEPVIKLIRFDSALGKLGALLLVLIMTSACSFEKDSTCLYAVQISAIIQSDPPQITLQWPPDSYGADSYTVSRKLKNESSWGPPTVLQGSATKFTDEDVSAGATYEYQIVKQATLGYTGFGYIYAGIEAPMIEER